MLFQSELIRLTGDSANCPDEETLIPFNKSEIKSATLQVEAPSEEKTQKICCIEQIKHFFSLLLTSLVCGAGSERVEQTFVYEMADPTATTVNAALQRIKTFSL